MYLPHRNVTATSFVMSSGPKAAITVAIALALLAIGFGISRLFNRYYRKTKVIDSLSDLSDHTKHLLKLQKTARRERTINQAEICQWQLTVLSMWRNRPSDEEDGGFQDDHGQMLKRLRDAWISRRRCHNATVGQTSEKPCAQHADCSSSTTSSRWATPEELAKEVRRVAHAWLEFSRSTEASAKLRDRRRRSSHHAMMRRLSSAWRERGQALDPMWTIEEAADASCEEAVSFVSVGKADHLDDPDALSDQTFANARDTNDDANKSQPQMPAEAGSGGSPIPAAQGVGGYCRLL